MAKKKLNKVIKGLQKASKTHAKQAKTLQSINMQIWLHLNIVKILTMLKAVKEKRKPQVVLFLLEDRV